MTSVRILAVLLIALLPVAGLAQGAEVGFGAIDADTDAPVEVTSDDLSINQDDGTALFTGNVVVGQGEMRMSAPRVLVVYTQNRTGISRLEARGGVTLVSGKEAAEGDNADYDVEAGTVVMTGNVLLTQGANALTADRMVADLNKGTARMTGRVKTVIQQGNSE
ncbi:LptA/OstA family protein [Marinovum sp. 2_MG-2023]|uniref:LptA/OstA family protein n=1 Tax=unclassified Marinovum TaxID=2647166 RepID=UPI0026E201A9|nr:MULTISPECIES: LptA/OstA family protein [unclassified Marinovum]MDO6732347.1 LptA/OstA family protein [Marinovum sp. 2_MG-2023]MDO6781664.1 LptA/OstA family protein [Marinovum sp. 1_MG-2023]